MVAVDGGGSSRADATSSVSIRILAACLYTHLSSPAGGMRVDTWVKKQRRLVRKHEVVEQKRSGLSRKVSAKTKLETAPVCRGWQLVFGRR